MVTVEIPIIIVIFITSFKFTIIGMLFFIMNFFLEIMLHESDKQCQNSQIILICEWLVPEIHLTKKKMFLINDFLKFTYCRLLIEFRSYGKKLPLSLQMLWRFTLNHWMKTNRCPNKSWIHRWLFLDIWDMSFVLFIC